MNWLFNLFKKPDPWIYGTCRGVLARKHKANGNVQFVLWKAGEQGYTEDYWHNFGYGHGEEFKEMNNA